MSKLAALLDRLDRLSPWAFTGTLYVVRWLVIVPLAFVLAQGSPNKLTFDAPLITLLFGFIVAAPLLETLVECAAPYWIMRKAGAIPVGKRPWVFVAVAAVMMTLLHVGAWPLAIIPSLVTGGFLGYTYGHFAPAGFGPALVHTSVFHAGINLVGWVLVAASGAG